MVVPHMKKLCLAFLAATAQIAMAQDEFSVRTGEVPCPSNSSMWGYVNTTDLNLDIIAEMTHLFNGGEQSSFYHYKLCPNTTFPIARLDNPFDGEMAGMDPIVPGLSDTIISCGEDGLGEDNCVFEGGSVHFFFHDLLIASQVFVAGITFEGVEGSSVYGDAHHTSHVNFINCHWRNNAGGYTVYIYHTPNDEGFRKLRGPEDEVEREPYDLVEMRETMHRKLKTLSKPEDPRELQQNVRYSMSTVFVDSTFHQNANFMATILNFGGSVEVFNTTFSENDVASLSVFTILANGHAYIHGFSHFRHNFARLGPVFVDQHSFLHLSRDNEGVFNAGSTMCEGIFLEDDESFCFDKSRQCTGECCEFGDESCDLYDVDMPSAAPSAAPSKPQSTSTSTSASAPLSFSFNLPQIPVP